ncbi:MULTISPECIES: V-type ATP synthase subunit F [Sedimentisphaera]|uniref:V-type sodium pump subunit G n=2 Tax=Sedimentisphaera TaxID=2483368 RepID=A0A1W6LJZ8_9BACT|nr:MULTISPECIES: V-type ATP synthase subunit F [Sedimentisphaera]AQQ08684.1 V-type sodium pump subunit G [Sedimentisphaera cyanobacteriorum]ARN56118.1 V-type sodium pump subunit G [Sedimentisphaera salicampi]OXU15750.1 V-type sodium pump subunit G [Sedimentisphaera salicampi]
MQGKAAVLGSSDFVMPFSALGLDTHPVHEDDDVSQAAENMLTENYSLIVVSEDIAHKANEVFEKKNAEATPCVLVLPFVSESEGFAMESLGKVLKLATGIDILKNG